MQDAYGPMFGIPVTVIISRDGKICAKHTGISSKENFEQDQALIETFPLPRPTVRSRDMIDGC